MQTHAAILERPRLPRPYARSRPLTVEPVELAAPGPGELLVAIDAAGICHSDLSVVDGSRPRPTPMGLGHEATGIVTELGPHVTDIAVGDRVVLVFVPSCGTCASCTAGRPAHCPTAARANTAGTLLSGRRHLRRSTGPIHHHLGISGFAQHAVVDRRSAVVVPADTPAPVAALFGCAVLTGAGALRNTARLVAGESAAVVGLGGVGMSAILGAVLANAYPIVAIDPIPAKRHLALALGATHVAAPADAPMVLGSMLADGADVVLEAAGRPDALELAWRLTRRGGRTVTVGLPDPSATMAVPIATLVGEGRAILGSYLGDSVPQRDIPRYLALWRAGRFPVDLLLDRPRPLTDINAALDDLANGTTLRQVVLPGPSLPGPPGEHVPAHQD